MRTKTDETNPSSPLGTDLPSDLPAKKLLSRQNDAAWWRTPKADDKKQRPSSPGRKPSFRTTAHRTNSNPKHRQAIKVTLTSQINRVAALATKFDSLDRPSESPRIVIPKSLLNGSLSRNVNLAAKIPTNCVVRKKSSVKGAKVRQAVSNFEDVSVTTVQRNKATQKPTKLILDAPVVVVPDKKHAAIFHVPKDMAVGSARRVVHKGDFRSGKTKKTEGRNLVVIDFENGGNVDVAPTETADATVAISKTEVKLPRNKSDASQVGDPTVVWVEAPAHLNGASESAEALKESAGPELAQSVGNTFSEKSSEPEAKGTETRRSRLFQELKTQNGRSEVPTSKSTTPAAPAVTYPVVPKKSFLHSTSFETSKKGNEPEAIPTKPSSLELKAEMPGVNKSKLYGSPRQSPVQDAIKKLTPSLEFQDKAPLANSPELRGSRTILSIGRDNSVKSGASSPVDENKDIPVTNASRLHGSLIRIPVPQDKPKKRESSPSLPELKERPAGNKSNLYGLLLRNSPSQESPTKPEASPSAERKEECPLRESPSRFEASPTPEARDFTANKSKLHGLLSRYSPMQETPAKPLVSPSSEMKPLPENKSKQLSSRVQSYTQETPTSVGGNSSFLWRKNPTALPPSNPPPSPPVEEADCVYTAIPVLVDSEVYDDVGPEENIYDDIGVHTRPTNEVHAEGYETCDGSTYDDCEGEGYQFVDGNASRSIDRSISDIDNVYDDVGSAPAECETNYEAIDVKPRPLPMPPPVVAFPSRTFRTGPIGRPAAPAPNSLHPLPSTLSMGRHDSICSSASSSRSGSGGGGSYCGKQNSIYGDVISELSAALAGTDMGIHPPSETSDEWIDVDFDPENIGLEHNTFVVIRDQPARRRNGRWSRNVRNKWRARQGPRLDAGHSSSDTDVENQYETLGEVKSRAFDTHGGGGGGGIGSGQTIIFDGSDSFDSDSENEPIHATNLHVDVTGHMMNGQLPSPPVRENIYGVNVTRIKEAAGKSMEKLRKNFSMKKNDISSRLNRMRRKSSVDPIDVTENWSRSMEKSHSTTQITGSSKYFSFKKRFRRNSSVSMAALEVKSTFYLTEVDIASDKNGRASPLYGGSTHADTASNISASSSNEGRSSPRSSPGGVIRRPFLPAPPIPPPVPPLSSNHHSPSANNHTERRSSGVMRPRSPPPPPPPPVPKRNNVRDEEIERDAKSNSHSFYAECNLLDRNGTDSSLDNDHSRRMSRADESTNGSLSPYAAAGLYGGSQDGSHPSDLSDTSSGHNSSGSVKHLFCDEPLYQFYNVSIFECQRDQNSEMDSDGYEEIVDGSVKPRPTAMELIRPRDGKHRTLWCEIPEVRESHVLSSLSSHQKKLQEAKFEMITSEASYVKSLNVLERHFINSPELSDESVLSKTDRHILFANIEPVRKKSESFLADLEKCWQHSIMLEGICKIVYDHAKDNFNIYTKYCTNQVYLDRTLRKLRDGGGRFAEALAKLEGASECQLLSLHSFLMLPMQRITRLPLLLDAVLRRLDKDQDEYDVCQSALASLNKVVAECNEGARTMERYEDMMRLTQQLRFPPDMKSIPISSSNRWLVRCGSLVQIRNYDAKLTFGRKVQKATLFFFLFSDMLFITKRKGEDHYMVIDYCLRNMLQIESPQHHQIAAIKNFETTPHLLLFTLLENHENKTVEMVLSCESESDSERWLATVSSPQSENPGETVYEEWDCPQVTTEHAYVARQPDELSLNVGDVVNVFKKLDDGWFEGERIRDRERGWFPGNHTVEIASAHVKAKNLRQRYRFLALSGSYIHRKIESKEGNENH